MEKTKNPWMGKTILNNRGTSGGFMQSQFPMGGVSNLTTSQESFSLAEMVSLNLVTFWYNLMTTVIRDLVPA